MQEFFAAGLADLTLWSAQMVTLSAEAAALLGALTILIGGALALIAFARDRVRKRRTADLHLYEHGAQGMIRITGVTFDQQLPHVEKRRPVLVTAYDGKKRLGRTLRMRIDARRASRSFGDDEIELSKADAAALGADLKDESEATSFHVRNAHTFTPAHLWFHPDPDQRLGYRVTFAVLLIEVLAGAFVRN
jgi:hypothetical protein